MLFGVAVVYYYCRRCALRPAVNGARSPTLNADRSTCFSSWNKKALRSVGQCRVLDESLRPRGSESFRHGLFSRLLILRPIMVPRYYGKFIGLTRRAFADLTMLPRVIFRPPRSIPTT